MTSVIFIWSCSQEQSEVFGVSSKNIESAVEVTSSSSALSSLVSPDGHVLCSDLATLESFISSKLDLSDSLIGIKDIEYVEETKYTSATITYEISTGAYFSSLIFFRRAPDLVFLTDQNSVNIFDTDTADNPIPDMHTITSSGGDIIYDCGDHLDKANCATDEFCDWNHTSEASDCGCHGQAENSLVITTSGKCSIEIK